MKRFFSILALVAFTFALISCGGDDGPTPPPGMPKSVDDNKNYTYEFSTFPANSTITLRQKLKLSDFKKIDKTWLEFVNEAKVRSTSKMEVLGIKKSDNKIKNLTLKVEGTGIVKKFADDEGFAEDGIFNFSDDQKFMQQVMTELVSERTLTLELTATTEKEIKVDKEVKVKLYFDVLFKLQ